MKLSQVAQLTAGELQGTDLDFQQVSIDTRTLQGGDLFVAIRGDRFDGHDYLTQAADQGACAALTEKSCKAFSSYVQVSDSRRALGQLAAGWAEQFSLRRLAVTGNAGKTTVKEMLAVMLADNTLATRGNLNNDIGVPLTLLRVRAEHRYGVFELGANAPGEIAWTSSLVRPEVALVTNVTGAHLEGFGSMQGIADAKAEIFSAMGEGGSAIINADDQFADHFTRAAEKYGLHIETVSMHTHADWRAVDIRTEGQGVSFTLEHDGLSIPVSVPLPGRHQVSNALLALAAVAAVGVPPTQAIDRLKQLKPMPGRMNVSRIAGGNLVDDSYNANPGSVRAAVDFLVELSAPHLLILGEIGELGPQGPELHRQLGAYARDAGVQQLIAIGNAAPAAQGFADGQVTDKQTAADLAAQVLGQGGSVLVKGSRSAAMEQVIEMLTQSRGMH